MKREFFVERLQGPFDSLTTTDLTEAVKAYYQYPKGSSMYLLGDWGQKVFVRMPPNVDTFSEFETTAQAKVPSPELTDEQKFEIVLGLRKLI